MFFTSDDEVYSLAGAFYGQYIPLAKWDKSAQLAITLYYAIHLPHRIAFDILSARISGMWAGGLGPERRSELEKRINTWLEKARQFASAYENIDEISALTNIFIANNWELDPPYPRYHASEFLEADTGRLWPEDFDIHDTLEMPMMPSFA
jgi:hypothetical protein